MVIHVGEQQPHRHYRAVNRVFRLVVYGRINVYVSPAGLKSSCRPFWASRPRISCIAPPNEDELRLTIDRALSHVGLRRENAFLRAELAVGGM
ncbi:MAG: hypothetical protein OSB41_04450 [Kiritimatiellae bacterium]|nr:hypothetical protein [Kiritimatiellia bacterium]